MLKGTIQFTLGKAIAMLIGWFTTVYMARLMGPTNYGIFCLMASFIGAFSTIFSFGIGDSLSFFIPKAGKRAGAYLREGLKLCISLSLLAFSLALLSSFPLSSIYGNGEFFRICSLGIIGTMLMTYAYKSFQALKDFRSCLLMDIAFGASKFIPLLLFLKLGLIGAIIGLSLMPFFPTLFMKKLKFKKGNIGWREILSYSILIYGSTILPYASNSIANMLLAFFSTFQLGLFGASQTLSRVIMVAEVSFSMATYPIASGIRGKELRKFVDDTNRMINAITFPLAFSFLAASNWAIDFVYGAKYLPAIPIFRALCIVAIFASINAFFISLGFALGRAKKILKYRFMCSSLFLILSIFLIPILKVKGLLFALLISTPLLTYLCINLFSDLIKLERQTIYMWKGFLLGLLTSIPFFFLNVYLAIPLAILIFLCSSLKLKMVKKVEVLDFFHAIPRAFER